MDLQVGKPTTHPLGRGDGVRKRNVHEQTRELLTTDSCKQVIGPERLGHSVGEAAQRPVAGQMSVCVVDEFELIKIERDQCYGLVVNCRPAQASRCVLQKRSSIPNACQ